MENRFKAQVAVVTGGARGIGAGIGERLAAEGAKVILWDILADPLQATVMSLREKGLNISGKIVDITRESEVKAGFAAVEEKEGRLDIVINSAGIIGPSSTKITDYSYEDFRRVVEINLNASFLVTKYAIPLMEKNNYGRILLVASIGGKEGNPGMAGYAASKSGVIGLVKGIGKEYAGTGITVNGLAPAVISTPMNLDTDPQMLQYMMDKIPMKRLGTVEEVASLAAWIVSPEASFNTGFVFDLSGGRATY
ncbi:MAG: SDR family NAD(P)-dependent oxidoreductase [Bacteroidia bacterium]|nr:SDR family NAD(P)-dependent oxidoreductase [Bacteroidia bacterium]